ncbi:hypothetical protein C9374_002912 [Naegleria lovaniensis]|uniref:EF-hand domain-containing protein n=1 Tax=Naegleria lovaniensis TaxID=51637 RepID=A0AA88KKH1_NAELO|nr:uncharacterized protein C9374_002912 [Naegleria lovaniensis]KAG2385763.1 hypothetical protein C9374_002912 [Naegleria lovaniensis]
MGNSHSSFLKKISQDLANGISYEASELPKNNRFSKMFEKLDKDKSNHLTIGTKRMAPMIVSTGKTVFWIVKEFVVPASGSLRQRTLDLIFQFLDVNDDQTIDRVEFISGLQRLLKDVLLDPVFSEYQVESNDDDDDRRDEEEANSLQVLLGANPLGEIPIVDDDKMRLLQQNGHEIREATQDEMDDFKRLSQEQYVDSSNNIHVGCHDRICTKIDKSQIPIELCHIFRSVEKASSPETTNVATYTDTMFGKEKKWVVVVEDSTGKDLPNTSITVKKGEVFRLFNNYGYFWYIGHDKFFTFRKGFVARNFLRIISQQEADELLKTHKK